ncbi:MAG: hypothetical protein ACE5SW_07015 [Nitrososphaeraceae archaeon]
MILVTINSSSLSNNILFSFKIVFSNIYYLILAAAITISFWIIFNILDQLLFFYPTFFFYLPEDAIAKFITSTIISILLGVVISMNVFLFKYLRLRFSKSIFSAGGLGILTGSCASCSSLGFVLASSVGGVGLTFSSFISTYEIHLQILSVAILIYAIISINKKLTKNCTLKN